MVGLSVFPFFALLAQKGVFNSALSWYTRGETDTLNRKQRSVIKFANYVSLSAYLVCVTALVIFLAIRSAQVQD